MGFIEKILILVTVLAENLRQLIVDFVSSIDDHEKENYFLADSFQLVDNSEKI